MSRPEALCPLCKKREPGRFGRLCEVCLGYEIAPDDPQQGESMKNYHCNACHIEMEKPEDRFYPSRRDKCIPCIKSKAPATPKPESGTASAPGCGAGEAFPTTQAENSIPAPGVKRICEDCSMEFEEYTHGCTKPKVCPECMRDHQAKGHSKRMENYLRGSNTLAIPFEGEDVHLLEWIRDQARAQRRTPENQLLVLLSQVMMQKS